MYGTKLTGQRLSKVVIGVLDNNDIVFIKELELIEEKNNNVIGKIDESELVTVYDILGEYIITNIEHDHYDGIDKKELKTLEKGNVYICKMMFVFIEDHYESVEYDMKINLYDFEKVML